MKLSKESAIFPALIAVFWLAFTSPAVADTADYTFQLVQNEVKKGVGAQIAVRLLNQETGEAVPDAVIIAKRIDMAPDGMAAMEVPLETLPSNEPGIYRFQANLMMAGRWQLSLTAKVPGEEGEVVSKRVLKVLP